MNKNTIQKKKQGTNTLIWMCRCDIQS